MRKIPTPHTITDVLAITKTEKTPIWGPITRKSITLLFGSTGVGKSYFTLGLQYAIAAKEKFCGFQAVGDHKTIQLDGEMDLEDTAARARRLRPESEMDIDCDSMSFLTREDFGTGLVPNISQPDAQKMYTELFSPYDVVFIDNLNTCSYAVNERDGEIQQFLRVLPWLLKMRDVGKAIVLVHHTNKEGKQMGSILKEQIATNVIELEKVEHNTDDLRFRMVFHKHRHISRKDAAPQNIAAIYSKAGMTWLAEAQSSREDTESRVLSLKKQGWTQRDIADELKVDSAEVYRILQRDKRTNAIQGDFDDF